jgi:hypothetical protein
VFNGNMNPNTLLGGIGLNIQYASIVIQTEPWWNHSAEMQAVTRCHRQNQTRQVKQLLLVAVNSSIDKEIRAALEGASQYYLNGTSCSTSVGLHQLPFVTRCDRGCLMFTSIY